MAAFTELIFALAANSSKLEEGAADVLGEFRREQEGHPLAFRSESNEARDNHLPVLPSEGLKLEVRR